MHPLQFIAFYFVRDQMTFLGIDTIRWYNHHILCKLTKKENLQVTLMQSRLCLCGFSLHSVCGWMQEVAYHFQAATVELNVYSSPKEMHWCLHNLITFSYWRSTLLLYFCGLNPQTHIAGNSGFLPWIILIYPFLVNCLDLLSLFDLQQFPHQMPRMPTCTSWM